MRIADPLRPQRRMSVPAGMSLFPTMLRFAWRSVPGAVQIVSFEAIYRSPMTAMSFGLARLCQVVGASTKRGVLWPVSGCNQLVGEVIPKGESIVSSVSVTSGGEAVTVGAKEGANLIMCGAKALGMMR